MNSVFIFIHFRAFLDEERDEDLYAQALNEAEGDEVEAEHIYFSLYMQSIDK